MIVNYNITLLQQLLAGIPQLYQEWSKALTEVSIEAIITSRDLITKQFVMAKTIFDSGE